MGLTVKTAIFQGLVSKALKGCGTIGIFAQTRYLIIESKDGVLTLTTTDGVTYFTVIQKMMSGSDFYACVEGSQFGKLISKLTAEDTALDTIVDEVGTPVALTVSTIHGQYKLVLPKNETGGIVRLNIPKVPTTANIEKIYLAKLKVAVGVNKSALSQNYADGLRDCLLHYYFGEQVLTSDQQKLASTNLKFFNEPALLSSHVVDLLTLSDFEEIEVARAGDKLTFSTGTMSITTTEPASKSFFPADPIMNHLNMPFESSCEINKKELLEALDRLMIFINPSDNNAITFTFKQDGLHLDNMDSVGHECLQYLKSDNFKEFKIRLNIASFKGLVADINREAITLEYGNPQAIKLTTENSKQILASIVDVKTATPITSTSTPVGA
jgi:DNA polymerase III sliding clamp (beta) subunit (PCNA family)